MGLREQMVGFGGSDDVGYEEWGSEGKNSE